MPVMMVVIIHIQTTFPRAKIMALHTGFNRRAGCICALALNVVVMAFLHGTHLVLEPQNLRAIFASATGQRRDFPQLFGDAFGECFKHLHMVIQIAGLDEFNIGICRCNAVGKAVNPVDQNAGKQEIRKHDDAFIAELCRVFQTRLHQREGHAGITDFTPAKPHAFPKHPADFGNISVGIRIRGTAADNHQTGLL